MKTETKNGTATNGNGKSLMPTRNDMPVKVRTQMIQLLNAQLADTFDLMSMAKQAHWNVRGPHFIGLHKLFDEVFEAVEGHVDLIAERCTALGGVAHGTVRMAAKSTRLEEYPGDIHAGQEHVEALADRIAAVARSTREAIDKADEAGDMGTSDMFTDVVRSLDQYLWFVEAHLRPER